MESEMIPKSEHNKDTISDQRHKELQKLCVRLRGKYSGLIATTAIRRPAVDDKRNMILAIIDDLNTPVLNETVDDVKSTIAALAYEASLDIDAEAMLASDLWLGFLQKDDVVLDMLRDVLIVQDIGFMRPIQDALVTGKIRPSKESVNMFLMKSDRSLKTSNEQVSKAILDIYWALTDAAHAAVMTAGITPPAPTELARTVNDRLVKGNMLNPKCPLIIAKVCAAAKRVTHKQQFVFTGKEYDEYREEADFAIKEMRRFVETYSTHKS